MKLAIISDVHANLEALEATLQKISTQNVDQIVCLGDIVGYNANPSECIALLQESGAICVGGNHDRAAASVISTDGFSPEAARAIEWTKKRLSADDRDFLANLPLETSIGHHLVAVHGALLASGGCELSRLNSEEIRKTSYEALKTHRSGARICAFGNTHRVKIFELRNGIECEQSPDQITLHKDAFYLVNPGSVGKPRERDRRASYLTFNIDDQTMELHRVIYDFSSPISKACDAGLLPFYARYPESIQNPIRWTARALRLRRIVKHLGGTHQRRQRKTRLAGAADHRNDQLPR